MVQLTLTEAATLLDPPMSETQLRLIVRALAIQPVGHRRNGQAGRPQDTFDAAQLHQLHGALAPWLARKPQMVELPGLPCIMGLRPHARNRVHEVDSCRKAPHDVEPVQRAVQHPAHRERDQETGGSLV